MKKFRPVNPLVKVSAALLSIALTACGSVGDGTSLQKIEFARSNSITGITTLDSRECLTQNLTLLGRFSDGTVGNFTNRARYFSEDPTIAQVTIGDVEVADQENQFYLPGTLLPGVPGTTTVTAEFVGLTASLEVTVSELGDVTITPSNPTLGPGTLRALNAEIVTDGRTENVSGFGTWTFTNPDLDIATINLAGATAGLISTFAVGGPLTAQVNFPLCNKAFTTDVTVEDFDSLTLEREFNGDNGLPSNAELVLGTSEAFFTYGNFASGAERQDISTQVAYNSTEPTIFTVNIGSAGRNIGIPFTTGGPLDITANFGAVAEVTDADGNVTTPAEPGVTSNSLPITIVDGTIDSIAISPLDATVPQLCNQQYTSIATFDGGARQQEITRHTIWVSSDPTVATISREFAVSGLSLVLGEEGESTTISGTVLAANNSTGEDIVVETPLTAGPVGACP